jgi:hypothetical protein
MVGDKHLAGCALQTRFELFRRFAADPAFASAVKQMRHKLEEGGEKGFKAAPGGIYDIDFLTTFLQVKHGIEDKAGTLRDRIWCCADFRLLTNPSAAVLDHAAELFRTAEHATRLIVGRGIRWLPTTEHARHCAERLTSRILRRSFPNGLEEELLSTAERTRAIYESEMSKYAKG